MASMTDPPTFRSLRLISTARIISKKTDWQGWLASPSAQMAAGRGGRGEACFARGRSVDVSGCPAQVNSPLPLVTGQEIRRRFPQHSRGRDHLILASAPLVPVDDPTTLFLSAGMQPLQPDYPGRRPPPHGRLASCQKCFRTGDLEEVGRTDRHDTFFEMLGNFAPTGDYFNETAIPLAWELVTDRERGLGLPRERLRVVTHPTDESSRDVWRRETDVNPDWIYESEDNWWGLELGPCGPDTELWWDRGVEHGCGQSDCHPDHCDRFLEFWNLVLPQYDRQPDGSLPPLPRPAIDTGMGMERITSILQGVDSIFETDLFLPIMTFVQEASAERSTMSERVVADHL